MLTAAFIAGCGVIAASLGVVAFYYRRPILAALNAGRAHVAGSRVAAKAHGAVSCTGWLLASAINLGLAGFSAALGAQLALLDAVSLLWFRDEHSPIVISIMFVVAWVFPFVALWLLFRPTMLLRPLSYPLFFLTAYFWTWTIRFWPLISSAL